jgi:hypothetical protein
MLNQMTNHKLKLIRVYKYFFKVELNILYAKFELINCPYCNSLCI